MAFVIIIDFGPKIDVPNLVTYLNHTPKFERFVVWCGSKNS